MRSGKKKRNSRLQNLAFFIPIILVIIFVVFAVASNFLNQDGTIVIRAASSGRYYPTAFLQAPFSVAGTSGVTPDNISLVHGSYTVIFGKLTWYRTPAPMTFYLAGGRTYFATGIYAPVLGVFAISSQSINASSVSALHGITPIVWLNRSGSAITIEFHGGGRAQIAPGGNFTFVYQTPGEYQFTTVPNNLNGTIEVQ